MDQDPAFTRPETLAFKARRTSFARVLMLNALLTLMTLGIYRFWAKTRVRRYFWRNIRFLDDPLEYTGTGGELFVGFLIVIAILFPLGLIYSAIGAVVPPDHPELEIGLEIAYYIVLFALLQIGFYRMWRYRMSRTAWRGVRFGLDGSTWSYLRLSAGWSVLCALTLGAAYPWMQIDLWRYQVRHTRLGDQTFRFDGDARKLVLYWLPVFAAIVINVGVAVWAAITYGIDTVIRIGTLAPEEREMLMTIIGGTLIADIIGVFGYLYYRIRQTRLQISGLRFAEARFHSRLGFWRLFLFGLLAAVLVLAMFAVIIGLIAPSVYPEFLSMRRGSVDQGILGNLFLSGAALFIAAVIVSPFVWTLLFHFEVIKQTVRTTTIDNPHVLEHAAQSSAQGPRTGEGLADALDIGGF